MLQINSIKNVTLENIKFNANQLVLLKIRENANSTGEVETTINYIEICELKDTKDLTAIQELLKMCVAEFRVAKGFESDYKETGITQKRMIQPFLNTNVIFKTDSCGKISKAVISEIPLNKTALNVKLNHNIMKCETKNLKAAIYQHSKAVLAQCSYISLVDKELSTIQALCKESTTATVTRKPKSKSTTATFSVAV